MLGRRKAMSSASIYGVEKIKAEIGFIEKISVAIAENLSSKKESTNFIEEKHRNKKEQNAGKRNH